MEYSRDRLESLQHRWTTTKGKALLKTIRQSRCYLSPVLFRQKVKNFPGIKDDEIDDGIDLRGAPLAGFDFRVKLKDEDNGFTEEIAILSNIHFEGASLKHCKFNDGKLHECYFEDADLSHADFEGASLSGCKLSFADCSGINLRGSKLINCEFLETDLTDVVFDNTFVDERTNFGKELKSDKDENYHFASIQYKQIKEMYKNSSLHSLADKYHYKEMVAKRKSTSRKNPMRWLNFLFGDLLCKYGTSFIRVLIWSSLIILITAFLHIWHESLLFHNQPVNASFLDALYFSIVTFTTLGYGDYHAIGFMRFVAALEAFGGAALMSLFTVIVARNLLRD